jgi:cellulose synthase/poly-beta-1,6-N-acetylglucosamine synthase-like glycosyltransferase
VNWSKWIRQAHRWLSIAFTIAVVINIVALVRQEQAVWVGFLALFPLILLLLSGLYLFVLPYTVRWQASGSAAKD